MKKFQQILMAFAAMIIGFSSCGDDDVDQAMVLSGEWEGDFGMSYCIDWHGEEIWFDADYSVLTFIPAYDLATHGTGYEMDYYMYGPYESEFFKFRWKVDGGEVIIKYYDPSLNDLYINNYYMDNDYFGGRFQESGMKFKLFKRKDFYDWTPWLEKDHSYKYRNDWTRSRTVQENDEDDLVIKYRGLRKK
ncbi:MAG: hypothetical protein Q4B58_02090 [Bacteroidales bacterium]|nr:hypothetical protein [Bacteroidales bacterium]